MTRRSVTNDRYRVERSGKTRKSASAAKPKRTAGEAAAAPAKKSAKSRSALGRAVSKGQSKGQAAAARIEQTPRMKQLRRVWWGLMGAALALAAAMWYMSANKLGDSVTYRGVLLGYVTAIAGALYLEFGPLRRARFDAAAASKGGKKAKPVKADAKPAARSAEGGDAGDAGEGGAGPVASPGRARATDAVRRLFGRGGAAGGGEEGEGPS